MTIKLTSWCWPLLLGDCFFYCLGQESIALCLNSCLTYALANWGESGVGLVWIKELKSCFRELGIGSLKIWVQSWFCGFTHILSVLLLLELSPWAELPSKGLTWEQEPVCRVSVVWDSNTTCQPYNIQLFYIFPPAVSWFLFLCVQSICSSAKSLCVSFHYSAKHWNFCAKHFKSIHRMSLRICTCPVWSWGAQHVELRTAFGSLSRAVTTFFGERLQRLWAVFMPKWFLTSESQQQNSNSKHPDLCKRI